MKITVRSGRKSNATSAINVLRTPISELCGADHGNDQLAITGWIANKTNTAKHRLLRISPTAHVGALGMSLTSQSTVQNIATLSEIISSCDLVIDTAAGSGVFRMAVAVCTQKSKPLISGRIEDTQAAISSFTQSCYANLASRQASLLGLWTGGMPSRHDAKRTLKSIGRY